MNHHHLWSSLWYWQSCMCAHAQLTEVLAEFSEIILEFGSLRAFMELSGVDSHVLSLLEVAYVLLRLMCFFKYLDIFSFIFMLSILLLFRILYSDFDPDAQSPNFLPLLLYPSNFLPSFFFLNQCVKNLYLC